ncbi:MAG: FAD-dependent oxidoreductase [Coriobacteriales bacterium]
MNPTKTALLLGFGTAALNAAVALRAEGFDVRIAVVSNTSGAPYSPVLSSYCAGGVKSEQECHPFSEQQLAGLRLELVEGDPVALLDVETRCAVTASGRRLAYDACLVATGSSPATGGFPTCEGFEPKVLRTPEHALALGQSLQQAARDERGVLVSGSSMVALKALEACLERGAMPTLLARSEHILKKSACTEVAALFEQALEAQGVQLMLGRRAVEARALAQGGVAVTFDDGSEREFADVLLAHGMRPNLGFIAPGSLACEQGLVVDEHLRCSVPGVYAAGDVAQALNLCTGSSQTAGTWTEACAQGRAAGSAMAAFLAGREPSPASAYPGFIPGNTVYVHGATLASGGVQAEGEGTRRERIDFEHGCAVCTYRREGDRERLQGFNVFSSKGKPGGVVYEYGAMYARRLEEEMLPACAASAGDAQPQPALGSQLRDPAAFWGFAASCTECGRCRDSCSSLSAAGLTLGGIARGMLSASAASPTRGELAQTLLESFELTQAVRGCFLCTGCQQTCFAGNAVLDLVHAARVEFQELGLIPRSAWASVQVDHEWDVFTTYRAIQGIGYADLTRHLGEGGGGSAPVKGGFSTVFFPGCSLAAYSPALTREVFATLESLDPGALTMVDRCCGSSLKSAGFYGRAQELIASVAHEAAATGASQVVCACPGCRNNLGAAFRQLGLPVQAVTLAGYLLEKGFTPKRSLEGMRLRISKSCQDRDGRYLDEVCQLLGLPQDTPVAFGGCCGAGGSVGSFSLEEKQAQTARKLAAVREEETIVSMCPTCTYTYAYQLLQQPRAIGNKNYLELVFENQFCWEERFGELQGQWSGEYAPWLAQVLS